MCPFGLLAKYRHTSLTHWQMEPPFAACVASIEQYRLTAFCLATRLACETSTNPDLPSQSAMNHKLLGSVKNN